MSEEEDPKKVSQSDFQVDSEELAKKRQTYYDKWRSVAKEEVEKTKEEEEELSKEAKEKLGLDKGPKSEAEKKDGEKRAALREAKKMWDGKKALEEAQVFTVSNLENETKVLKRQDVDHRPVLRIVNCKGCTITISEDLGSLIKLFIEECEKSEFVLKCPLITQHVEISHSSDLSLKIAIPTETIQLDLIDGMNITYAQNCLEATNKLYHAGVKRLQVHCFDKESVAHDYSDLEDDGDKTIPEEEKQYVTHLKNNRLVTERVRRASGMMPMTDEELAKVAGTEEIENAHLRQAQEKKTAGNEAFGNSEFMQAGVFYTQAMKLAPSNTELICVCLANRAACNLKLGRLEEALDDADACVALNPNYTKGWFRKGMALHAMKNYGPAIAALSQAESLEPKNKQILEALGFAKVLHEKKLKEEAQKLRDI